MLLNVLPSQSRADHDRRALFLDLSDTNLKAKFVEAYFLALSVLFMLMLPDTHPGKHPTAGSCCSILMSKRAARLFKFLVSLPVLALALVSDQSLELV